MNRRRFCRSALAAGAAALPASRAFGALFQSLTQVTADVPAVKLNGAATTLTKAEVQELADSLSGVLLTRQDAGYDEARQIWNGMHQRRPALISRCANIQDVAHTVTFARENGCLLAVRGGGHSFPGKSQCEGGIMLDLSGMKAVEVDTVQRRARIGGGALLYELDKATQEHGLATTAGVVSHTGVGGLTLGGGFGRLNRKFGLTIDNLIAADMVTADGRIRHVSADEDADLFWGIRGGGGNFGVVSGFEFQLHPVGPKLLGGNVVWPMDQARGMLEFWAEWAAGGLSDDLYAAPFMTTTPDGVSLVGMDLLYAGDPAAGEKEMAPIRGFGKPMEDGVAMVDYLTTQTAIDDATPPGLRYYIKNGMIADYSQALVDTMIEVYQPIPGIELFYHTAGGAVSRVAEDATAWPHRNAETMIGVIVGWDDPAKDKEIIGTIRAMWAEIEPLTGGYYANLREETETRTVNNYGPSYERLTALKNTYDPGNLFRLNANIKPTV